MPTRPTRLAALDRRLPPDAVARLAQGRAGPLHLLRPALLLLALAPPGLALADGLRWPAPALRSQSEPAERWSPWQGRIGLSLSDAGAGPWATSLAAPPPAADGSGPGLRLQGMRVLGDYYFSPRSGFHATGGLISGPLAQGWNPLPAAAGGGLSLTLYSPRWAHGLGLDAGAAAPRPYLGAGYSLGSPDGRWSFSADIGLVGRPGDGLSRWSADAAGWSSLGERLGGWQVQPLVQLGVSYSF